MGQYQEREQDSEWNEEQNSRTDFKTSGNIIPFFCQQITEAGQFSLCIEGTPRGVDKMDSF